MTQPNTTTQSSVQPLTLAFLSHQKEQQPKQKSWMDITGRKIKDLAINHEQRSLMTQFYEVYVSNYNDKVEELNAEVHTYNAEVATFLKKTEQYIRGSRLERTFKKNHRKGRISTLEYNQAVELFNQEHNGLFVAKREHITVKECTDKTFKNLLFHYSVQIQKVRARRINHGATTATNIPKISINSHEIVTAKNKNGTLMTRKCNRAVRDHIERLYWAGVLFDYENHGPKKPTCGYVNNEILCVFDRFSGKTLTPQNQLYTKNLRQDSPKLKQVDSSNIINNNKKNEIVENNKSLIKGTSLNAPPVDNYSTGTPTKLKDVLPAAAQKSNPFSEKLREEILDLDQLTEGLAAENFTKFRVSPNFEDLLVKEELGGNMCKLELKELLAQTCLKLAAPMMIDIMNKEELQKDPKFFAATWRKAHDQFINKWFSNNNESTPTKKILIKRYKEYHGAILEARRLARKTNWKFIRPGAYFDPSRTSKYSGGFGYVLALYRENQQKKQDRLAEGNTSVKAVALRKKKEHQQGLLDRLISQFLNKKINWVELADKVAELPLLQDVRDNFPRKLEYRINEFNRKSNYNKYQA